VWQTIYVRQCYEDDRGVISIVRLPAILFVGTTTIISLAQLHTSRCRPIMNMRGMSVAIQCSSRARRTQSPIQLNGYVVGLFIARLLSNLWSSQFHCSQPSDRERELFDIADGCKLFKWSYADLACETSAIDGWCDIIFFAYNVLGRPISGLVSFSEIPMKISQ